MRQALTNANADLSAANPLYVVQITGDNQEGKAQLDNFIDPEKTYPVIATTSKLMSTGVDAQTCKLIVLDQNIKSMTLFKQIIGRGTRLREDLGKTWFTIIDFKRATDNFADPAFDGDPVQIYEPKAGEQIDPPEPEPDVGGEAVLGESESPWPQEGGGTGQTFGGGEEVRRYIVDGSVNVTVAVIEAKDNVHSVGAGMQQAIGYAELLSVPFSFSSNGDGFVFRDATLASGTLETTISLDEFRPFKGAMAKLSPNAKGVERVDADTGSRFIEELDLAVNRTTKEVNKSYEIYLALYQAVSGTEEEQNIYKQFSPDFFDLVVVDELLGEGWQWYRNGVQLGLVHFRLGSAGYVWLKRDGVSRRPRSAVADPKLNLKRPDPLP